MRLRVRDCGRGWGGVIISIEIFTLKYCSSVRIYVCRKGFKLVLYITAWVLGVVGGSACMLLVCLLSCEREKKIERKGDR